MSGRDVREHGRREHARRSTLAAGRDLGARRRRPRRSSRRCGRARDGEISADTSVASSSGSPTTSASTFGHELLDERVAHRVVDVDALHRDAGLARVAVAAGDDLRGRELEVGVGLDDHRRVVAELEPDLLARRAALDAPADLGRAGERDHRDVVVVDERVADGAAAAGDDVEPARRAGRTRRAGSRRASSDGERRLRRGLQDDRAPGRDRGRDLVAHEVEREVERADRADDADRARAG